MNPFIEYELKVAVALAVFTMFYKLLLQKDTFHRFNRVVLLVTSALAFALPFCVIVRHKTVALANDSVPDAAAAVAEEVAAGAAASGMSFMMYLEIALAVAFFAGAAFMFIRIIYSIVRIRQLIAGGRHIPQDDGTVLVVVSDNDFSPVSWMKYIVMSEEDHSSANEGILIHERAHIALGHSWDILFFDLMTVLQWFNPAIWLLKADLRAIHEYEADEAVIKAGTDMREYQLLLVRKAVAKVRYQAANSLNHSTLKNRIKMMSTEKSSFYGALKALYVLPLAAVSLVVNAETKYDYIQQEPETIVIKYRGEASEDEKKPLIIVDGKVVDELDSIDPDTIESMDVIKVAEAVDELKKEHNISEEVEGVIVIRLKKDEPVQFQPVQMPKFENKDADEFSKWVNMQTMYPEAARNAKSEGRVYVCFTVKEDGSLGNVKVLNSVHPAIDAEIIKVVSSSPKWTPAYVGNEIRPGGLSYAIPVTFDIRSVNSDTDSWYKLEESSIGTLKGVDGDYFLLNEIVVTAY